MRKTRMFLIAAIMLVASVANSQIQAEIKVNESPLDSEELREWRRVLKNYDYTAIAAAYADYMIEHGRDVYGKPSPLFVTGIDRHTGKMISPPFPHVKRKPFMHGWERDRECRDSDRNYGHADPLDQLVLLQLMHRLTEITGEKRYAKEADKTAAWWMAHCQTPIGLYPWGTHAYWNVENDSGRDWFEFNHPWPYWELDPEALQTYAMALWDHYVKDKDTGDFNRHANAYKHAPDGGMEFPWPGSAMIATWVEAYLANPDPEYKRAIKAILKRWESLRDQNGHLAPCTNYQEWAWYGGGYTMAANRLDDCAELIENKEPELASMMRDYGLKCDEAYLKLADNLLDVKHVGIVKSYLRETGGFNPDRLDILGGPWQDRKDYAHLALLLYERAKRNDSKALQMRYHQAVLDAAEVYMSINPEVQWPVWGANMAYAIRLLLAAHDLTGNPAYLHRADHFGHLAVDLFLDETSPLPKITSQDDFYEIERVTGDPSDVWMLAILELDQQIAKLGRQPRHPESISASSDLASFSGITVTGVNSENWEQALKQAVAEGRGGIWDCTGLSKPSASVELIYGANEERKLFLSKRKGGFESSNGVPVDQLELIASDFISKIPTLEEAKPFNGPYRRKFSGKHREVSTAAYGGFKDVLDKTGLLLVNQGKEAVEVLVRATFHDSWDDSETRDYFLTLDPDTRVIVACEAPDKHFIRRLDFKCSVPKAVKLKSVAFEMVPRSQLTQTKKEALVFLMAGQSNAGGVAAFSQETNIESGMAEKHPTIPGSTAKEVGIPTNKEAYPKSFIWKPGEEGPFEPLTPGVNLLGGYNDPNRHGIELPMAMMLEKQYPDLDKFFVKHGPAGHNLHTQWEAKQGPDYVAFIGDYRAAMSNLEKRYDKVRIIGLYWDQGESDQQQALQYEKNLRALFTALREDIGIPDLQIYVRKHLFQQNMPDFKPIIDAQVKLTREDSSAYLLDLDLGSIEKNFKAWAWTDNNGHLSSKAYLELSRRIMALPVQELRKEWGPFVGPWERYDKNPVIGLEDRETYSIQNGPQSVINWKDRWYMFLMTSQPMVTKLAVSDDGLKWDRPHHNYLLEPEMDWEGSYNLAKAAVVRENEVWLYYFGKKDKTEMIALARSKDLENWRKEPTPIFTHEDSRLDGDRAFPDCVIKEGDTWYMYYDVGFDYDHPKNPDGYAIGVATSKDGINWSDSPESPVLKTSERTASSWEDGMVSQCSVHKIGEWFYMLYSGSTNNYGRKYSGKNRMAFGLARARHPEGPWEKYPHNPVFTPTGNEEDFDGIYLQHPCPVKVGNHWRLYYNGWTKNEDAKNSIGAEYAIGVAFVNELTHNTYYVDGKLGNDANSGTAADQAWQTLEPVNALKLLPGDKVLLKTGCEFAGPLSPHGSGVDGLPIVIDRYGEGSKPVVAGEGKIQNTIHLHNQQHWEIRNLTITNTDGGGWDDDGRALRRAIYVTASDAGDINHIYLENLEIRDVRGMYRFAGNQTNGGIICQVKGKERKTRFVDLRIGNCVFLTKSIDRYPVVVTSVWGKEHPGEIFYDNNNLDHAGRAHIVIPADHWPRKLVYYFDPEVQKVFPLEKTAAPISPFTGRVGCEDIFSEIAARLKRSWSFFEATRAEKGQWLYKYEPGDKEYSLWATSSDCLAYYGELRALGFEPPWINSEEKVMDEWIGQINKHLDHKTNLLNGPARGAPRPDPAYLSHSYDWICRNRVFMADHYSLPPGGLHGGDPLPTKEAAIKSFNSKNWDGDTYQVCNIMGKEIKSHAEVVRSKGFDPAKDEIIMMLHEMIDAKFANGRWGINGNADGNMKMAVTYCTYDWPIPNHKELIDFTLDGANGQFKGRGCSAFNQMWVLAEVRRQFPDGYRGDEIDQSLAQSFLTFLGNWNEQVNFYSKNWGGKHNNGVTLFMTHLLLDIPVMRGSTVCNWRQNPIITRGKDGTITRNKVTYTTPGFLFYD